MCHSRPRRAVPGPADASPGAIPTLAEQLTLVYQGKPANCPYLRMFTARATTRMATTSESVSSNIIKLLAHGLIADTSVGLNAVADENERVK